MWSDPGRSFEETGPPLPGTRPGRDGGLLLHRSRKFLNPRSVIANRDRGGHARVGSEGKLNGSTTAAGRIEDRNLLLAAVRRETFGRKQGISGAVLDDLNERILLGNQPIRRRSYAGRQRIDLAHP